MTNGSNTASNSASIRDRYVSECQRLQCKCNTALLKTLPSALNLCVTEIDLNNNFVGPKGLRALLGALFPPSDMAAAAVGNDCTHTLRKLCVADNYLSNESVVELCDLMDTTTALQHLDLSNNPISHVAGKRLSQFASRHPTLSALLLDKTLINPALVKIIGAKCEVNRMAMTDNNAPANTAGRNSSSAEVANVAAEATLPAATEPFAASNEVVPPPVEAAPRRLSVEEIRRAIPRGLGDLTVVDTKSPRSNGPPSPQGPTVYPALSILSKTLLSTPGTELYALRVIEYLAMPDCPFPIQFLSSTGSEVMSVSAAPTAVGAEESVSGRGDGASERDALADTAKTNLTMASAHYVGENREDANLNCMDSSLRALDETSPPRQDREVPSAASYTTLQYLLNQVQSDCEALTAVCRLFGMQQLRQQEEANSKAPLNASEDTTTEEKLPSLARVMVLVEANSTSTEYESLKKIWALAPLALRGSSGASQDGVAREQNQDAPSPDHTATNTTAMKIDSTSSVPSYPTNTATASASTGSSTEVNPPPCPQVPHSMSALGTLEVLLYSEGAQSHPGGPLDNLRVLLQLRNEMVAKRTHDGEAESSKITTKAAVSTNEEQKSQPQSPSRPASARERYPSLHSVMQNLPPAPPTGSDPFSSLRSVWAMAPQA